MSIFTVLYDWGGLNLEVFTTINGFRGPLIDDLMLAGTQLGDVWNAAWIVMALLLLIEIRRVAPQNPVISLLPDERILSVVLSAFVVGSVIATALVFAAKAGFHMPRPYNALPNGSVKVLAAAINDPYSFPSGHAAFAMLVVWIMWPYSQKIWRAPLTLCVFWVGISRISVGAHFPADVLAGYIFGGFSGWLATKVMSHGLMTKQRQVLG